MNEEQNKLTPEERSEFNLRDSNLSKNKRQIAIDLREIKAKKLYREDYSSWERYVIHRGFEGGRQADRLIEWVNLAEPIEARCGSWFPDLSPSDCKALEPLADNPELQIEALIEAHKKAKNRKEKRTSKLIEARSTNRSYPTRLRLRPQ